MRKLVTTAVAIGVSALAASSASAATYYVARAQPHDAKISFRVKAGVVDAGFTQTKGNFNCKGDHFDTVSAGFDIAKVEAGRFDASVRRPNVHRDTRQVLAGKIDGDTATGRTRITTRNGCDTGKIMWEANRVSKARWQKFNLPHFHP